MAAPADKSVLRAELRALRRSLPNRPARAVRIWEQVWSTAAVSDAARILVFDSIDGEPDTAPFIDRCRAEGLSVAVPEDEVDPTWPDVVIVPGIAFTGDGRRLGQGGGWYDRFLPQRRAGCTAIGVCFEPQLLDDVPTEPHDAVVDLVITD